MCIQREKLIPIATKLRNIATDAAVSIREALREKKGVMQKKFQNGGAPSPPHLGISAFLLSIVDASLAIFSAPELEKKTEKSMEWVWANPHPTTVWEFPHIIPFLFVSESPLATMEYCIGETLDENK